MISSSDFAVRLQRAAARVRPELEQIVEETMCRAREEAQSRFGEYQRGWAPLSERTIERHGDTPLLDSGATRDGMYIEMDGLTGYLLSAEPTIKYSEEGTVSEPPRPLMKESVREAMRTTGISRMRFLLETIKQEV